MTSYAEVLATARRNVPPDEVGIKRVKIKKEMAGGIILEVPRDKERDKVPALAAWLAQPLDLATIKVAAPTRTVELRVTGIDISVNKEDL